MPRGILSRRSDTGQISWGKLSRLPRTVAESTLCIFDGYGLRGTLPARPTLAPCIRFLSIDSRVCSMLPDAIRCSKDLANEIAASEVPAPVLGHPTVGGAVARYVADAGERKVIPKQHDTVGRRLIEQPPP